MTGAYRYLGLIIALMVGQTALADGFNLPSSNNNNDNPFVQIHGLPGFSGVNQLGAAEFSSHVFVEINNEFFQKTTENEQVKLDYERTTLRLDVAYGLNEHFYLGLEMPYVINSAGFLDGAIEGWHDLFGLPQGGRDNEDRDQFLISYASEDQSLLLDDPHQGPGDISIYADWSVFNSDTRRFRLRTKLKLPTGDEDQLLGSGGYGLSLHLNAAAKLSEKVFTFAGAGISYLTEGEVLSTRQNNLVAVATLGLGWAFKPHSMLSAQVDLNTRVYDDSDLDAISGQAGVIYVSAQYTFSNQSILQLGFTEDIVNKDAAPDFGLRIGFSF